MNVGKAQEKISFRLHYGLTISNRDNFQACTFYTRAISEYPEGVDKDGLGRAMPEEMTGDKLYPRLFTEFKMSDLCTAYAEHRKVAVRTP
jgi:hypothetical protein